MLLTPNTKIFVLFGEKKIFFSSRDVSESDDPTLEVYCKKHSDV